MKSVQYGGSIPPAALFFHGVIMADELYVKCQNRRCRTEFKASEVTITDRKTAFQGRDKIEFVCPKCEEECWAYEFAKEQD